MALLLLPRKPPLALKSLTWHPSVVDAASFRILHTTIAPITFRTDLSRTYEG
jgi:hypothetical protein